MKLNLFICLLFCIFLSSCATNARSSSEYISVAAEIIEKDSYSLVFTIKNVSDKDQVYAENIFLRNSITLILTTEAPFGKIFDEIYTIDDVGISRIGLSPGESHKSMINLEKIYPNFKTIFDKHESLILFWYAKPQEKNGLNPDQNFGGYFRISK